MQKLSEDDEPPKPDRKAALGTVHPPALDEQVNPDVWRIHGRDYNMTAFLETHPGGKLALMLGKGVDCTRMFEQYHIMNEKHLAILEKYAIDTECGTTGDNCPVIEDEPAMEVGQARSPCPDPPRCESRASSAPVPVWLQPHQLPRWIALLSSTCCCHSLWSLSSWWF